MSANKTSALDELRSKDAPTDLDLAVLFYGDEQGTDEEIEDGERAAEELAVLREADAEFCDMSLRLREFVEKNKLGYGGENLDKIVIEYCEQLRKDLALACLSLYSEGYELGDKIAERHWKTWKEVEEAAK